MPSDDLLSQISFIVATFIDQVEEELPQWNLQRSPQGFSDTEKAIAQKCRDLQDGITTIMLRHFLADTDFEVQCSTAARTGAGNLRCGKRQGRNIDLLGGTCDQIAHFYPLIPRHCSFFPPGTTWWGGEPQHFVQHARPVPPVWVSAAAFDHSDRSLPGIAVAVRLGQRLGERGVTGGQRQRHQSNVHRTSRPLLPARKQLLVVMVHDPIDDHAAQQRRIEHRTHRFGLAAVELESTVFEPKFLPSQGRGIIEGALVEGVGGGFSLDDRVHIDLPACLDLDDVVDVEPLAVEQELMADVAELHEQPAALQVLGQATVL